MKRAALIAAILLAFCLTVLSHHAAALEVGDRAPGFELPSTQGGRFRLSELAGRKHLVVQFYVIDFTPT